MLLHLQPLPNGERAQVPVLVAAADEIRRLLHQFAAGFLPKAQEAIEAQLSLLLDSPRPGRKAARGRGNHRHHRCCPRPL